MSDRITGFSSCLAVLIIALLCGSCVKQQTAEPSFPEIEKGFRSVPDSVRTGVYWYWLSDNLSKEGVVKDLEAMKTAGINRAFIGNIGLNDLPYGKVRIFTPDWWDILHAALKKATELNIEIGIFNSPGWSQSGGPWVRPEQSMRWLNSSETVVKGPGLVSLLPEAPCSDFQRVSIIAFRAPENYGKTMKVMKAAITCTPEVPGKNNLIDGDTSTFVLLRRGEELSADITFPDALTVRSIIISTASIPIKARLRFMAGKPGYFNTITETSIDRSNPGLTVGFDPYAPVVISVPETTSESFRLVFTGGDPSGGISEIGLSGLPLVERYPEKSLAKMFQTPHPMWHDYMWPAQPEVKGAGLLIDPKEVTDLTSKPGKDGRLEWNVPEGEWVIMQTGMTSTGVINEPATPEGTGLEADKMSKKHIASHFDAFLGEIMRRIPPEDRKTWKIVVEDSYERGGQNWTDGFADEFRARYGYDPLPYLPVLRGYVVGDRENSDRFLWDLRRLIADKVAKDYVGGLREISHANGLTTWLENYGHWGFPAEFLQYGGQSDEVAGEFWSEGDLGDIENRAASSCAHIYGKRKVSAESFTCAGAPFSRYPALMKKRGDRFFTEGINNTLLHVYIQQPDEKLPGMNAWFGNEFNRHNTWFSQMNSFTNYLKRANFMLQQGTYVADVAYFIGEDVPKMTGICIPALPDGYSFDYINSEVIMSRLTVKKGLLTLPDGMSYRMLVLPELETMRPELLRKISELVLLGAVVMGPPPAHSPSLENYPGCDRRVKELVTALWGKVDGSSVKSSPRGKGMILSGLTMKEALDLLNIPPDFCADAGKQILFIHRNLKDGDFYFLSNQSDSLKCFNGVFRVSGLQPELWDPVTGTVRLLPEFSAGEKSTTIPLRLEANQSCFVIFRKSAGKPAGTKNFPELKLETGVSMPWTVSFDKEAGGPVNPVIFNSLSDWSENKNDSIKYYSGTAVYRSSFDLKQLTAGRKYFISTGEIPGMARIIINGSDAGGVWTAPWQAEISSLLKEGHNEIELTVVNTWVNRLIGDSRLPEKERKTWCPVNPFKPGDKLAASGLKGPVGIFSAAD